MSAWFAEILAWLCIAAGGGMLFALARWLRPGWLRPLLPPQRTRAAPWGGLEIGLAFFFFLILQAGTYDLLTRLHFFQAVYGEEFPAQASVADPDPAKRIAAGRIFLWSSVITAPLLIAYVVGLFRIGSGAQPYQLGLTPHRACANAALGYLTWLFLSPLVLGVNILVELIYGLWKPGEVETHPLFELLKANPRPFEWGLVFASAVVATPVSEEFIFRGIVQPWLCRRTWGGDAGIAAAFAVALAERSEKIRPFVDQAQNAGGLLAAFDALAPAIFVLAMIPGYIFIEAALWRWLPYPYVARGIYGTSLLFAAFHSAVWPTPIALFPLAMGLGLLAYRTQSLVGPVTLHAAFNAISCLALLFSIGLFPSTQSEMGKLVTSAPTRLSPSVSSTGVPGASLPLRTNASATAIFRRGEKHEEVTCPTSLPSRNNFDPRSAGRPPEMTTPFRSQFTWPRSRLRTIGSCPGKQPFVYEIAWAVRPSSMTKLFSSKSMPCSGVPASIRRQS